ncbi:hypothetical protein HELRODRAFT_179058 [Helobdella robusta]|uniref:Uncharacterized protein n=1 Tax=Helobdella robusta TaxID=6412 RepID=T1FE45_HELRO|nr:hypothetical protein HELRODRAFT_179058 [Helobdella robusta]ESN95865.1 hypothetical protein HELRODRAFT_179058 [Helobdella robusta]
MEVWNKYMKSSAHHPWIGHMMLWMKFFARMFLTDNTVVNILMLGLADLKDLEEPHIEREKQRTVREELDVMDRMQLHSNAPTFHSIPRHNSRTFKHLRKVVPVKEFKRKYTVSDALLLRRLIVAADSGRDVDLKQLLRHELHEAALSLAMFDGYLRLPITKGDAFALAEVHNGKFCDKLGGRVISVPKFHDCLNENLEKHLVIAK